MDIQPPEPQENNTTENPERSSLSKKLTRAGFIGAFLLGGAALLSYCFRWKLFHHTIPPIIIKSTEQADVPTEIDTENLLEETPSGTEEGSIADLPSMLYTMKEFDLTKYVKVCGEKIGSKPEKLYTDDNGLAVNIWLQKYEFNEWRTEIGGPHFLIRGTSPNFHLTCAQLSSPEQDLGNEDRPWKRSFSDKKKWRIGKVQVGNHKPIDTSDYINLEIHFDDHYEH